MSRVTFRVCVLAAALLAAGGAAPALGQQPPAGSPSITVNQVDASRYPDLTLVVTALDPRGLPVRGLTPKDFQAFDGKDQLPISSAVAAQDQGLPLTVVVAIDVSGSMQGDPIARAKQAATQFVQSLGPNDQAAIVAFSDSVIPVVPLTGDRASLTRGVDSLTAAGNTALYEAVQTASYVARSAKSPRAAVVLLTDGQNETQTSSATADGSVSAARGAGLPVFTIGFGAAPDANFLQQLSTTTQGQYRSATAATVGSVYADISALLRNQYVITTKANRPADGGDATLQVIAFIGGTPAASVANYKRGAAPVVATIAAPTAAPAVTIEPATSAGSSNVALYVFAAVIAAIIIGVATFFARRWYRRRSLLKAQLAVVAPNVRQAAAQPLPTHSAISTNGSGVTAVAGTGRLLEKGGEGREFEIGGGPTVIGSSARSCTIVLPSARDIAPEHARIWLRDGRYMLHHVGGMGRRTVVANQTVDWVTLDPGDEIVIGHHRFVFQDE